MLELIKARVAPAERPFEQGIRVRKGRTQPFIVERGWAGPSGNYTEQWSIRRGGDEIVFEGEEKLIYVRGIQSITSYTDEITQPVELAPGEYNLVFLGDGLYVGSVPIEVSAEEPAAA